MLGLQGPFTHFRNQLIFRVDRDNHFGQHETERHLRVIAFNRTCFIGFGDDRQIHVATELLAHLSHGTDTGAQAKDSTSALAIEFDLPRQIRIGINTLLLSQLRHQKGNDQGYGDQRDYRECEFHDFLKNLPGAGLCHTGSPKKQAPKGIGACKVKRLPGRLY